MKKKSKDKEYKCLSPPPALCACSALPPLSEGTVEIDGVTYCEGALVDTVNFESLLEEHPDLDEIWVGWIDRFEANPQTGEPSLMRWQIFANCLRRRSAKTMSNCSNIASGSTKPNVGISRSSRFSAGAY